MSASGKINRTTIPSRAGIGLRAEHFDSVLGSRPDVGWFEAHSENYFGIQKEGIPNYGLQKTAGGKPFDYLQRVREHYPVSLHGVGLSIGSTDVVNRDHLQKLRLLIDRIEPGLVSEHLSWGSLNGKYFNDLLPMPYTEEALEHMVKRVDQVQHFLGRQILIENVSSYLEYKSSTIPEWEFIAVLAERTGCGLLLDINNVYVNAMNHCFDAKQYLQGIPVAAVKEIHLAGHTVKAIDDTVIRLDTHDQRVCVEVWELYRQAIRYFGDVPTLIEWDRQLPELSVLVSEAMQADDIRKEVLKEALVVMNERIA